MILKAQVLTFFMFGLLFGATLHQLAEYKAKAAADKAVTAMIISFPPSVLTQINIHSI